MARGDSLYVLDGYWGKVSVFSPQLTFAYSFTARNQNGSPRGMMVPDDGPSYVFAFSPGSRRVVRNDAQYAVRPVTVEGEAGDTLFTARPYQVASKEMDRGMLFMSLPFGRTSKFALGPDGAVYHGWQDSLQIDVYDQSGTLQRTIDIPFEHVPVMEDEREEALEGRSGENRTIVENKMPSTKPAFDEFFVDDRGRYWFGRPTANPDSTDWWVAWPEEKRVATGILPSDVQLEVVKDGRAYGRSETEAGAPVVVRYDVSLER